MKIRIYLYPIGVSWNDYNFSVYDTLAVTVRHPDLIDAEMWIGDEWVGDKYIYVHSYSNYYGTATLDYIFSSADIERWSFVPVYIYYKYWDGNTGTITMQAEVFYIYIY